MVFPEAWPVAISRGDFTAAAGWFCFSFDCFSLDCATATSDKHANPNTRILLFIFSLLCAGNGRHWLSRSERQTSYPHSDSEMLGACAGPRKLPRYWLAVWRGRPRPRKFHRCGRGRRRSCAVVDVGASALAGAPWGRARLQSLPWTEPKSVKPSPSSHSEAASAPRNLLFDFRWRNASALRCARSYLSP